MDFIYFHSHDYFQFLYDSGTDFIHDFNSRYSVLSYCFNNLYFGFSQEKINKCNVINKMKFYSQKIFYLLTIIALLSWIFLSLVPSNQCVNTYVFGGIHWDICDNMSTFINTLYVVFQILVTLISAYLIIIGIMFFNSIR